MDITRRGLVISAACAATAGWLGETGALAARPQGAFRPGQLWLDNAGKPIQAHAGSLIAVGGDYYWYGENKEFTDGKHDVGSWGIRFYRSRNLYDWDDLGPLIPPDSVDADSPLYPKLFPERPHILFNPRTRKFVCWIKIRGRGPQFRTVLTADRITGPYTMVHPALKPAGMAAGDFDLVADPTSGKAFMYFEHDHSEIVCIELSDDWTDVTDRLTYFYQRHVPDTREGIACFRRESRHRKHPRTSSEGNKDNSLASLRPCVSDMIRLSYWTSQGHSSAMSRTVVEARIQDRTARVRLGPRNKPYWRTLSEGAHLGYRRGARKGTWVARYFSVERGAYVTSAIAEADDIREADGRDILSYKQAFDAALRWIEIATRGAAATSDPDMTVGDAVRAYIATRDARRSSQAGRALHSDAYYTLTRFVLEDGRLPVLTLAALAEGDLRGWQLRMARKKPSSIQRVVNDLKAALNLAFEHHRKVLPTDLPVTIKYGLKVDAPEVLLTVARDNQILTDDQVRRVVAAAIAIDEDFGRLVVLLAATGARFSQIARMTVGDVQAEQSRLMVPQSFKGRKRQMHYIRVQVGADTLAALAPVVEGRLASASLLEHWRHRQIGPMEWERVDRGPWTSSASMLRTWKRAIDAAGLPSATIPYGLRHSSIVRGLRAGLPIRLVAALHDTSVAMIERHYSRWITEGLDELVARAVVPIVAVAA